MNPAIEKLEKEIDGLKYELTYNSDLYVRLLEFKLEQKLESLKASVEALEKRQWNPTPRGGWCADCLAREKHGHYENCPTAKALTLVNRAMGVSHE